MKSNGNWWGWAARVERQSDAHAACCEPKIERHYGKAFQDASRWAISREKCRRQRWEVMAPDDASYWLFDTYAEAVEFVREQL